MTLALAKEMEEISETVFNLTWLITWEDFRTFTCCESFKSLIMLLTCIQYMSSSHLSQTSTNLTNAFHGFLQALHDSTWISNTLN
jgi:uncharacterized protein VirK/YbjX